MLFLAPEALPDGTVLTVDRKDLRAVLAHPFTNQFAGHDEDFLGRERDVLAGLECGQGWGQRSAPRCGDDHQVDLGVAHRLIDRSGRTGGIGVARMCQEDVRFRMPAGDRLETGGVAPGNHGVQREAIREPFDQVADLPADGAGCTEQRQAPGRPAGGSHLFGLKRAVNLSHCTRAAHARCKKVR